jgi:hypothetical protein
VVVFVLLLPVKINNIRVIGEKKNFVSVRKEIGKCSLPKVHGKYL